MKLNLRYDRSRIKVGTWLEAEAGSVRATRDLVAACITNEDSEFLQPEAAQLALNDLTLEELDQAGAQLVQVIREQALNPTSGSK
jgi:hypothetical protein